MKYQFNRENKPQNIRGFDHLKGHYVDIGFRLRGINSYIDYIYSGSHEFEIGLYPGSKIIFKGELMCHKPNVESITQNLNSREDYRIKNHFGDDSFEYDLEYIVERLKDNPQHFDDDVSHRANSCVDFILDNAEFRKHQDEWMREFKFPEMTYFNRWCYKFGL